MEDNFFMKNDSTKIRNFIMIPKSLFTDSRFSTLGLRAKLAYSFYLRRYRGTSFKDDKGPYIIYHDYEIAESLDTNTAYAGRIKRQLRDAGLLELERTTRGDKIRVMGWSSEKDDGSHFFTEDDMEEWRFYRFSVELLDSRFSLLDLNVRMYYAMLFDLMCMSQSNYFTDELGRIYFQIPVKEQAEIFCMSKNTITKYKNVLQACGLLSVYTPFRKASRFYLRKLSAFVDNADMFYNMTASEKSAFLRKQNADFRKKYSEALQPERHKRIEDENDLSGFKKALKANGLTYQSAARVFELIYGRSLSTASIKKYLNGSRRIPEDVSAFFKGIQEGRLDPRKVMSAEGDFDFSECEGVHQDPKKEVSYIPVSSHPQSHITDIGSPNNSSPIINTEKNNRLSDKTIKPSDLEQNGSGETGKKALDIFSNRIHSFSNLKEDDALMILSAMESVKDINVFTVTDGNGKKVISRSEVFSLLESMSEQTEETDILKIINDFSRSDAASSISRSVSYIRTAVINLLYSLKHYSWFVRRNRLESIQLQIYRADNTSDQFPDSVKNFNPFS